MDAKYFDVVAHAELYRKYRPVLPREVFQYLADLCVSQPETSVNAIHNDCDINGHTQVDHPIIPGRRLAVDLGCGSGQATFPLADHFHSVIGVDLSEEQINLAPKHKRVSFHKGPAENLPFLEDRSVDLAITVSALHWFDVPPLVKEMRRILRDGGVLCAIHYRNGILDVSEGEALWYKLMNHDIIEHYPIGWQQYDKYDIERIKLGESYVNENMVMKHVWSMDEFVGYVSSNLTFLRSIPGQEHVLPDFREKLLNIYRNAQPGVPDDKLKVIVTWHLKLCITRNTISAKADV